MNRRPPGLLLSKCIVGFLQYKTAEGLSPNTIASYERMLNKWLDYRGDALIEDVTTQSIRAYLAWLRTEYKPQRKSGCQQPLSPKTIRNIWVALSAFFSWAKIEFEIPSPMNGVPAPQFTVAPVEPFCKDATVSVAFALDHTASEFCADIRVGSPNGEPVKFFLVPRSLRSVGSIFTRMLLIWIEPTHASPVALVPPQYP